MNKIINAVVQNRQIIIPASDDLPDGTNVEVQIWTDAEKESMEESDWDDSPEGIEAWLAQIRALQPFLTSKTERDDFEKALEQRKAWEKTHFFEHADALRDMWQ